MNLDLLSLVVTAAAPFASPSLGVRSVALAVDHLEPELMVLLDAARRAVALDEGFLES
jgi:hypothetical protein